MLSDKNYFNICKSNIFKGIKKTYKVIGLNNSTKAKKRVSVVV